MRVGIYKTDEAPDLTLFLREGLTVPTGTQDEKWTQLKTVTQGEVRSDLLTKMELTGHCVVRLGRVSLGAPVQQSAEPSRVKISSYRWRRLPQFFRRILNS